jgi:hypothetical protein
MTSSGVTLMGCFTFYFYLYKLQLRLLDTRSHFSLENKLLIYKKILKPVLTYGLELWGSAKPSNLKRIQTLQSCILRKITKAPFYVSNHTLHKDLNIPFVHDLAIESYKKFHNRHNPHQNLSLPHLPDNPPRRLKRLWPRDLIVINCKKKTTRMKTLV